MTLSAEGQALVLFVRQIAEEGGVSIVVEQSLEELPVTLEVTNQTVDDVIAMVARRLGTQVTRTGDLYFLGTLRAEDRGVYLTRVGDLPSEEVRQVAELLLSENGRAFVSESGVMVVGDTVEVLARVSEAVEAIRNTTRDVWLVQLHLLDVTRDTVESFGFVADASVSASASYPDGSFVGADLAATLEAVRESGDSVVISEPIYLVNDGESVSYSRGDEFPIVTSVRDQNGVIENVRYEEAGSSTNITVRSLSGGRAVLDCELTDRRLTDTSISGFPVIEGYEYSTRVDVESGGTYLLTTFERTESSLVSSRAMSVFDRFADRSSLNQVWIRVFRVTGASGDPFDKPITLDAFSPGSVSEAPELEFLEFEEEL